MAGTIAGVVGAVSKEFCVSMESGLDGRNNCWCGGCRE